MCQYDNILPVVVTVNPLCQKRKTEVTHYYFVNIYSTLCISMCTNMNEWQRKKPLYVPHHKKRYRKKQKWKKRCQKKFRHAILWFTQNWTKVGKTTSNSKQKRVTIQKNIKRFVYFLSALFYPLFHLFVSLLNVFSLAWSLVCWNTSPLSFSCASFLADGNLFLWSVNFYDFLIWILTKISYCYIHFSYSKICFF